MPRPLKNFHVDFRKIYSAMGNMSLQDVYMVENFQMYCTRGQLNNKGGQQFYEMKGSQGKTEIDKEMI